MKTINRRSFLKTTALGAAAASLPAYSWASAKGANNAIREVGGVMMGEHVEGEVFRVIEVTVQQAGTVTTFVRLIWDAVASLGRFFARTGHQYTKFNYLGEWHSHPSFRLHPSDRDSATIRTFLLASPRISRMCSAPRPPNPTTATRMALLAPFALAQE